MRSSARPSESGVRRTHGAFPGGTHALFKLRALRDITQGLSEGRDFDESLRLALLVIMGTFSILKAVLFLEEEGELRARISRGVPPGVPPVPASDELLRALRRTRKPIFVGRRSSAVAVGRMVAAVEGAVPALSVEIVCPLHGENGLAGVLLLGPTLGGRELNPRQRDTLGVMNSLLSASVSRHRAALEVSSLNDVLRLQREENMRLASGMQEVCLDTIRAFVAAIEAKDPYTRGHSERVAQVAASIARGLALTEQEVEAVHMASILHDVGKIVTDRAILAKPCALTRAEAHELRKHPKTSYDILSEIRFPYPDIALFARHHHEWVNGRGYPDAKRGKQISLGARIIAVADAFDAMMSDRPYRKRLSLMEALAEVSDYTEVHFDPDVVRVFFHLVRDGLAGRSVGLPNLPPEGNGFRPQDAIGFLDSFLSKSS